MLSTVLAWLLLFSGVGCAVMAGRLECSAHPAERISHWGRWAAAPAMLQGVAVGCCAIATGSLNGRLEWVGIGLPLAVTFVMLAWHNHQIARIPPSGPDVARTGPS